MPKSDQKIVRLRLQSGGGIEQISGVIPLRSCWLVIGSLMKICLRKIKSTPLNQPNWRQFIYDAQMTRLHSRSNDMIQNLINKIYASETKFYEPLKSAEQSIHCVCRQIIAAIAAAARFLSGPDLSGNESGNTHFCI